MAYNCNLDSFYLFIFLNILSLSFFCNFDRNSIASGSKTSSNITPSF